MWGEPRKSLCHNRALGWEEAEKNCRLVQQSDAECIPSLGGNHRGQQVEHIQRVVELRAASTALGERTSGSCEPSPKATSL